MPDPIYTGPLVRIVGFSFGALVTITGGTNVSVFSQALSQLGGTTPGSKFRTATTITVKVTGDVEGLTWGSPFIWSLFGSPVTTFKLINTSNIVGQHGIGGNSGTTSAPNGINGLAGGAAISFDGWAVTVNNAAGNIWGGGGGGGGGGGARAVNTSGSSTAVGESAGGGGGAGAGGGTVATGFGRIIITPARHVRATVGAFELENATGTIDDGTQSVTVSQVATDGGNVAGVGGPFAGGVPAIIGGAVTAEGGTGGDGGDYGEAGTAGTASTAAGNSSAVSGTGGSGGAAGKAINLGGGSVIWLSGNNASQVKGAVS